MTGQKDQLSPAHVPRALRQLSLRTSCRSVRYRTQWPKSTAGGAPAQKTGYCRPPPPRGEPSARGASGRGARAPAAPPGALPAAAQPDPVRVRRPHDPRLLSDRRHRLAAVRDGERRLGGDRGDRQRRSGRSVPVHGRGKHAEQRAGAKRGPRLPPGGADREARIRAQRRVAVRAAALHPGADHADVTDRGVQPPPQRRSAALPLAAAESGPAPVQPGPHDAGADFQHARRAPRRHQRGRAPPARRGADHATSAVSLPCSTGRSSSSACASATPWSSARPTACSHSSAPAKRPPAPRPRPRGSPRSCRGSRSPPPARRPRRAAVRSRAWRARKRTRDRARRRSACRGTCRARR